MSKARSRETLAAVAICAGLAVFSAAQAAKRPPVCLPGLCAEEQRQREQQSAPAVLSKSSKEIAARVYGKIQFVNSFPDYKVKAVDSFADLHVQIVDAFPDRPGKWQIVNSFPDYKIQMVDSFPDFTVKFVNSFPGPQ